MPFQITRENIDDIWCDAVVDAVMGSQEACSIQETGAPQFSENAPLSEHDMIETVSAWEYELKRSGRRNSRYVIHTPIPDRIGTFTGQELIRHCYRSALQIVSDFNLKSVAFPLIGSESEDCPKEMALKIAAEEIAGFLRGHEDTSIILAVRDKRNFRPDPDLLTGLSEYIRHVEKQEARRKAEERMLESASTEAFHAVTAEEINEERKRQQSTPFVFPAHTPEAPKESRRRVFPWHRIRREGPAPMATADQPGADKPGLVLPSGVFQPDKGAILDESFSQMVLRKIDEKGFEKDADCYRRANINRQLFSKLRCDENYHPKKTTAVALAIALELSLNETNELLLKAGYSLSHSILFDVIVEYCILQNNYDLFEINELLFAYDQPLLGG